MEALTSSVLSTQHFFIYLSEAVPSFDIRYSDVLRFAFKRWERCDTIILGILFMYQITLKNDGTIFENNAPVKGDILMFLGYRVDLDQDYTLRGFFRIFEKYALLAKLNAFLPDCLQRFRACPADRCVSQEIDYLRFHKTVEMIGFPGDPRLEIYNTLCGVREPDTRELKPFQLESLLDMPLRLGKLKHIVFGDTVDVFEFETVFSLFEFIDGIIWELSFQGTPKQCAI